MGLWPSNQAKGLYRIRPYPDVKVCPLLTARRADAYGITDEGHIVGKGADQQFRTTST